MKLTTYLALSLLSCTPLAAATYVQPQSSDRVLLLLDKIPLDSGTVTWMAEVLSEIASTQAGGDAEKLRTSAKLIAIAKLLDPNCPQISVANSALLSGSNTNLVSSANLSKKTTQLWDVLSYLSKQNKDSQAHLLSSYVIDAMREIAPTHQLINGFQTPENLWQGIVADLDQFSSRVEPEPSNENLLAAQQEQKPTEVQTPVSEWKVLSESVHLPLENFRHAFAGRGKFPSFMLGKVDLVITPHKDSKEGSLVLSDTPKKSKEVLTKRITTALHKVWGKTQGADVSISTRSFFLFGNEQEQLFTAVCLMLDASLSDQTLSQDVLFFANLDDELNFIEPKKFWGRYEAVRNLESKRILVAHSSVQKFSNVLVFEEPDFFIKNEVISVGNIKESRPYSGQKDDPSVTKSSSLFGEIQRVLKNKSLNRMLTNRKVRGKLKEVVQLDPNHVSAKILLQQGSKNRPKTFSKSLFQYKVQKALTPVSYLASDPKTKSTFRSHKSNVPDSKNISQHATALKEEAKKFEDFISDEQTHIYDDLITLSDTLAALSRKKQRLEKTPQVANSITINGHRDSTNPKYRKLSRACGELLNSAKSLYGAILGKIENN